MNNLDLDAIKRDYEKNDWIAVMAMLPTLLLEVERLRRVEDKLLRLERNTHPVHADHLAKAMRVEGMAVAVVPLKELENAKRVGAAEELERMAWEDCRTIFDSDLAHVTRQHLDERAAELRAEAE